MLEEHAKAAAEHRKAMGPYAKSPVSGYDLEKALDAWREDPEYMLDNLDEVLGNMGMKYKAPASEAGLVKLI